MLVAGEFYMVEEKEILKVVKARGFWTKDGGVGKQGKNLCPKSHRT